MPPTPFNIFTAWFLAGLQSFGGGSSTFYLLHQACIERGWMDEEEFVRTWALAQISPGINLLKLTVLIGHRLCGWPGIIAGFAGLLLPSVTATVLMTAGFSAVRDQPLVRAAMRGILPATIGLSLAMGYQMGQPLLARARREGGARLAGHLAILGAAALLMGYGVSPVLVLLLGGAAAVVLMAVIPAREPAAITLAAADELPAVEDRPGAALPPEMEGLEEAAMVPPEAVDPAAGNLPAAETPPGTKKSPEEGAE